MDEVQLLGEFVSVLNGLADKKNCDVYVTGSNAKFLSKDIATEFGGRQVKKQLEVDFICNKGSKKYYIQSAYMLGTEEKTEQKIRPFTRIQDSFKKIVITSNTPKPFYNEDGILIMSVFDFLLNPGSLEI